LPVAAENSLVTLKLVDYRLLQRQHIVDRCIVRIAVVNYLDGRVSNRLLCIEIGFIDTGHYNIAAAGTKLAS